jgi:signal transduction histidine kinase
MHRTLALSDTLLSAVLTLLAAVSAIAAMVPAANDAADPEFVSAMAATGSGLVASLGLLAAAATRDRLLRTTSETDRVYVAVLSAGAIIVVGTTLLAEWAGLEVALAGERAVPLAIVYLVGAGAAGAAAVAFFRSSTAGRDPVRPWLATAAGIVAAAHLSDAFMSFSSDEPLSGGSLVRVVGWLALLIGGVRDFEWAHRRNAEDAVLGERRRLARELHDGLAQELAYITTESRRLSGHPGAEHLAKAAERALEESRAAILALTRPSDEPLERTIAVAAQSIGERAGIDVTVAVRPGLDAPADVRQALLRIVREAMSNAARHGRASTVRVSVDGPSPLVMAIADDGTGFDQGLLSMHERAANLGGHLSIESVVGQGTTVAFVLP